MQERVFAPLGMARSTFRPMMAITYPLAQGHEVVAAADAYWPAIRPAANNVATWPAGSMFSNVHDLSRFVIAFMNQGRLDGHEALKPAVIAKLSAPHAAIPGGSASYGYGLDLSERHGVRLVTHGGSRAGYGSTILMVPARRVAAIVLGNRTGSGLPRTAWRGIEMLLDLPTGALEAEPASTTAVAAPNLDEVKAWVGRYSQGAGSVIEIAIKNGALVVRDGTREQPAIPQGTLRLAVGGRAGTAASTLILVPGRDGRPGAVQAAARSSALVQRHSRTIFSAARDATDAARSERWRIASSPARAFARTRDRAAPSAAANRSAWSCLRWSR